MILDKIISFKQDEVAEVKKQVSVSHLDRAIALRTKYFDFQKALKADKTNIIAEVKKASPSKGIIREDFSPVEIAKAYEQGGAAAISVLTDKEFFKGDIEYLSDVRDAVSLPLLRKDFIIDDIQILEAAAYGADAVLLIAAVLDEMKINDFMAMAKSLKMAALVEVHNQDELDKVLKTDAEIIGINNRNLQTFDVDIKVSVDLAAQIPSEKIKVSESGIFTKNDIDFLKEKGLNAFLIGESLMRSDDISAKLSELL